MKSLIKRFWLLLAIGFLAFHNDRPAYVIFNKEGKDIKFDTFIKKLAEADVILFGELHNNPISHWMELQVIRELYSSNPLLVVGAEMFETDDQLVLDEYLSGKIKSTHFENETKLWKNYPTDYKPVVDFVLEKQLKLIATNVPRRYANLVSREGLNALNDLPDEAKKYLPALPIYYDPGQPGYVKMRDMMAGHGQTGGPSHPEYFSQAQAIKDATMADRILKNLPGGYRFVHLNGAYHSNHYDGIYIYLKKKNPGLNIITINCVEQETIEKLDGENEGSADFIIGIPADMTKTY